MEGKVAAAKKKAAKRVAAVRASKAAALQALDTKDWALLAQKKAKEAAKDAAKIQAAFETRAKQARKKQDSTAAAVKDAVAKSSAAATKAAKAATEQTALEAALKRVIDADTRTLNTKTKQLESAGDHKAMAELRAAQEATDVANKKLVRKDHSLEAERSLSHAATRSAEEARLQVKPQPLPKSRKFT